MDFLNFVLRAGYPYELAGLLYFLFFMSMSRGRHKDRYSARSRILTLIASIALVGAVPFQYGAAPLGIAMMFALVAVSIWSTYRDRRDPPAA